ncbi:hypothetical protein BW732_04715 [Vagococcus penaei]|uniref:Secreted protein n=1 Tax=Vagococcus penaei TaxID=633807 RepID=A0A1Q2D5B5_9ENTE|nr:hypothetical protein [Vagococcus penaei]AQP53602.1 hypothetical protein BW732_04715 [Vagococcus penaei]
MSRYLKQFFLSVALIFSLSSLVTIFVSAEPFDGNCIYRETLAEATDTKISRENCPICHLPEAQRFSHFNSCQLVNGTNTHQPARKYQRFNRPIQRDSSMDTQKKDNKQKINQLIVHFKTLTLNPIADHKCQNLTHVKTGKKIVVMTVQDQGNNMANSSGEDNI